MAETTLLCRITERTRMPMFVWVGVLAILLALAWQIFTAKNLLINLNDRTIQVAKAEREVAEKESAVVEKEKKVVTVANDTIELLERLKTAAPPPEKDRFSAAQMTLRDEIRRPILRPKLPDREEK